jgi:uncharacterized membrane protein (UPF0127 family)
MFIHEMDEHAGMLLMFPENRPVTMWMKNTYISLDLLFLNAQGKIDYIAASATPLFTGYIGPPAPEYGVLELKRGACERLGIKVGDVVLHTHRQHRQLSKPAPSQLGAFFGRAHGGVRVATKGRRA